MMMVGADNPAKLRIDRVEQQCMNFESQAINDLFGRAGVLCTQPWISEAEYTPCTIVRLFISSDETGLVSSMIS